METGSVKMGSATIGPSLWRNNTLKEIKLSQNVISSSDKSNFLGKSVDPLPHLREILAELSNDEAHRYFRQTRAVVCLLRESLIDTNEEIKSLTRGKEALEKALEHIRKDIKLNNECDEIRTTRPLREKDRDGGDDLVHAEKLHLRGLKRMLEQQLQLVQQQLQVLDRSRQRLSSVVQERSRVLDLICAALPSGSASGAMSTRSTRVPGCSRMAMSADFDRQQTDSIQIDPLGPYTPEADSALREARDARNRSCMLRKELHDAINRADKVQKSAHQSVNQGLTGKVAETVSLKQQLDVTAGENRHAINRAQRFYDATERSWGFSRGPVTTGDLTSRERLDRPIMRIFQRHPGTNMPEAQQIVRGGDGLLQSLHQTSRNLGMLRLSHMRLKSDIRDKHAAIDVDSNIVRLRRRKANHRWVMGEAF